MEKKRERREKEREAVCESANIDKAEIQTNGIGPSKLSFNKALCDVPAKL